MAQNLAPEVGLLNNHLGLLVRANTTQGVHTVVKNFGGEAKHFKTWIKSIEKFSAISEVEDSRVRYIALQTAEGPVSDFIQRYIATHPRSDWSTLKTELTDRFGEVTDRAHARAILRTLKQKRHESPQMFCERLITASEDAFDRTDRTPNGDLLPGIERILIDYFVDGIADNSIKMKLLRENPVTLKKATEIANNEQHLKARYQLRVGETAPREMHLTEQTIGRHEEPMQIDAARFRGTCYKCGRKGHKSSHCKAVRAVEQRRPNVTCWACGKLGHYKNQCPNFGMKQ